MSRLTPEAKQYIRTHVNVSDRKLQGKILEIYGVGVSHTAIWNYKKSLHKVSKVDKVNTKVDTQKSFSGDKKRNGKTKKSKDLGQKLSRFSQVINSIHINAHPPQRRLLKQICGDSDILTVREWIITKYTEALTN